MCRVEVFKDGFERLPTLCVAGVQASLYVMISLRLLLLCAGMYHQVSLLALDLPPKTSICSDILGYIPLSRALSPSRPRIAVVFGFLWRICYSCVYVGAYRSLVMSVFRVFVPMGSCSLTSAVIHSRRNEMKKSRGLFLIQRESVHVRMNTSKHCACLSAHHLFAPALSTFGNVAE